METVAVVLMVLGLIGVGSALVVLVRLRGQLERLGEQVDRVARRVEALPPDLSRVFGNRDRHIISVELLNLFELAHRETWVAVRSVVSVRFNRGELGPIERAATAAGVPVSTFIRNAAINAVSPIDLDEARHNIEALQANLDGLVTALGAGRKPKTGARAKRRREVA